jgi:hypothetical protein
MGWVRAGQEVSEAVGGGMGRPARVGAGQSGGQGERGLDRTWVVGDGECRTGWRRGVGRDWAGVGWDEWNGRIGGGGARGDWGRRGWSGKGCDDARGLDLGSRIRQEPSGLDTRGRAGRGGGWPGLGASGTHRVGGAWLGQSERVGTGSSDLPLAGHVGLGGVGQRGWGREGGVGVEVTGPGEGSQSRKDSARRALACRSGLGRRVRGCLRGCERRGVGRVWQVGYEKGGDGKPGGG